MTWYGGAALLIAGTRSELDGERTVGAAQAQELRPALGIQLQPIHRRIRIRGLGGRKSWRFDAGTLLPMRFRGACPAICIRAIRSPARGHHAVLSNSRLQCRFVRIRRADPALAVRIRLALRRVVVIALRRQRLALDAIRRRESRPAAGCQQDHPSEPYRPPNRQ